MAHKAPLVLESTRRPPLILLHGFRGSPIGLGVIADLLRTEGYEVHTPAMPPFGGAGEMPYYTPETYAEFVANYIRAHKLERPILIGHSMGSVIAAATAYHYPELVNHTLILLSPISGKTAKPFAVLAPLSAIVPRHVVDYATTRYLFVPHNHTLFREAMFLTHACSDDYPPKRSAAAKVAHFSAHYSVADFPLTQRVVIIAGARDRLVGKRKTLKLTEQLSAELKIIPQAGHLHNYEKPKETVELIIESLRGQGLADTQTKS